MGINGDDSEHPERRDGKGVGDGKGTEKSAMLQMDNPETTDGERHRPWTASLKSLGVP